MYKAGDFTNGKMNKIFKDASNDRDGERYDQQSFRVGTVINHKQFGEFYLISERAIAVKSAIIYCAITSSTLEDFYKDCDMDIDCGNEIQLKKVNDLIFPCGYDIALNWFDSFMMLTDRVGCIINQADINPCKKYLEDVENAKQC